MSVFTIALKDCLEEAGFSQKMVADFCRCSRTLIYAVLNEKKQMSETMFQTLVREVPLTADQKKRLRVAYYSMIYPPGTVSKIDLINKRFSNPIINEISTVQLAEYTPAYKDTVLSSMRELVNEIFALTTWLAQERPGARVITNYPFSEKGLDDAVYQTVSHNSGKIEFIHIVRHENSGKSDNNISILFDSLRYIKLRYSPYIYESAINEDEPVDVLYRYFYATDSFLILFNTNATGGMLLFSEALVTSAMRTATMLFEASRPMTFFPENILVLRQYLMRSGKHTLQATVDNYLCVGRFFTEEMLNAVARPDLPNREMLIKLAAHHYSDLKNSPPYMQFLTAQGCRRFTETGCLQEFPGDWMVPLPAKYRKEVLLRLIEEISQENRYVFILNDNLLRFSIDERFSIELYGSLIYVVGSISPKETSFLGEYVAFTDDDSIVAPFNAYLDFIKRNNLFYGSEYSIRFLNDLVFECDNRIAAEE